jgi:hypothetical protein
MEMESDLHDAVGFSNVLLLAVAGLDRIDLHNDDNDNAKQDALLRLAYLLSDKIAGVKQAWAEGTRTVGPREAA